MKQEYKARASEEVYMRHRWRVARTRVVYRKHETVRLATGYSLIRINEYDFFIDTMVMDITRGDY